MRWSVPPLALSGWRWAAVCAAVLAVALCLADAAGDHWLGRLDVRAGEVAGATVAQAAGAFAVAKALNSALSVASSATVGVTAVFAGGTLGVGQALAPLDRLVDEFSDSVLVAASAACALQLLVEVDRQVGAGPCTAALVLLAACAVFLRLRGADRAGGFMRVLFALSLALRIGVPLALVGADAGYRAVLLPHYEAAYLDLRDIQLRTRAAYDSIVTAKDRTSQWRVDRWLGGARDRLDALSEACGVLARDFDRLFGAVITMLAVLALRVLGLPLLLGWAGWRAACGLARLLAR